MTFIKHHWFGLLVSLFMLAYLLVFALVLASPRYDEQKRGFIPCTEVMAEELVGCQNGAWCMLKTVVKNGWCDTKVIGKGFAAWAKGEQLTPWANYLFTPVSAEPEEIDEGLQEFYAQTPDVAASMRNLRKLNQELEQQVNEPETNKNQKEEINEDEKE